MFSCERFLIVLPKRLGDTVFYTPALAFIKKHCPGVTIDAIVLTQLAYEVVATNPAIHQCYFSHDIKNYAEFSRNYDYLLELNYHYKSIQEIIQQLPVKKLSAGKNMLSIPNADHSLMYVASLINVEVTPEDRVYHLYPALEDTKTIEKLLESRGVVSTQPLIILHVGCHGVAKSFWKCWWSKSHERIWPVSRFIKLARRLLRVYPRAVIVLTGSNAETLLAKKVTRRVPGVVDLTGQTTVMQLSALVKKACLVVTGDTGLLHVACAMHVPLVALFLPANVHRSAPYPASAEKHVIVKSSLHEVTVDEVMDAVATVLA